MRVLRTQRSVGHDHCEGRSDIGLTGLLQTEYSTLYPNTNVHFYMECGGFCDFIVPN
jgi:hypothetical protein